MTTYSINIIYNIFVYIAHSARFNSVMFTMNMTNGIINTSFECVLFLSETIYYLSCCKMKLLILGTY